MKTRVLLVAAISSVWSAHAFAVVIFSATVDRRLISFDSATPGTLLSDVPISGPGDQFESVHGIDFRPGTGQLFALGNAPGSIYRLCTLNLTTGAATRVGSTDHNWTGNQSGFDFNPTVDRIRVVTDTRVSTRLHPDTGALVATGTSVATSGIGAAAYPAAAERR